MDQLPADTEADLLRGAVKLLRDRLPGHWGVASASLQPSADGDALITLTSPQNERLGLVASVKRTLAPRDLDRVVERLRRAAQAVDATTEVALLVVARYLTPQTRAWLEERGVGYVDATSNMRIVARQPALFLRDTGENRDPWRPRGRPRGNLKGESAARVIRALVDCAPPYSLPTLVGLSGASTGVTYRVVEFLAEQALVERAPRGPIERVLWREILKRWSEDFGFMKTRPVRRLLQPRGLPALMASLADLPDVRYAVTGSLAAEKWAPYAPPRVAMIYAEDTDDLQEKAGLREVDAGANVLVAGPPFDVVFERTESWQGVTIVAPSQAAVDLMTGPGRGPAEAEALLGWMEDNLESWRR